MIDFTSSLYLAMKHGSTELNGWDQLTAGVPAILREPPESREVSEWVARMQRLETGVCAPSTLHLYFDLFELLKKKRIVLFIDEKIYPVSKYGIEKFPANQIRLFRHFDAVHLNGLVKANVTKSTIPVIMTDGWCPLCGKAAPVDRYLSMIGPFNGIVVIDDTQAFGILGEQQDAAMPFGNGGGGTLKWLNIVSDRVVTVISLAKAFGAPMAVLSGTSTFVSAYKKSSKTRVHSSQVSLVHLQAALNALKINYDKGDKLRSKLWENIRLLKNKIWQKGLLAAGGIFPVQNISCGSSDETISLYERLNRNNIRTVLLSPHDAQIPVVSFIIRSDQTPWQINQLAAHIPPRSLTPIY